MNNQKNRFWTFCFSLVPGAGEMYFGLYRQGISLMLCFLAITFVPIFVNLSVFSILAVVLWFYSFLHVHNLRHMPAEEFARMEDKCVWEGLNINIKWNSTNKTALALVHIIGGAFLLWDNTMDLLRCILPYSWFSSLIYDLSYRLPRIAVSLVVIFLGLKLIGGRKKELEQEEAADDTVTEYTDIPVFIPEDTEEEDDHADA